MHLHVFQKLFLSFSFFLKRISVNQSGSISFIPSLFGNGLISERNINIDQNFFPCNISSSCNCLPVFIESSRPCFWVEIRCKYISYGLFVFHKDNYKTWRSWICCSLWLVFLLEVFR